MRGLRKHGVEIAAASALALVLAVGVIQLSEGDPNTTTLILLALAIALLFGLLAPKQTTNFLQRMKILKVAGVFEVGLEEVVRAEVVRPPGEEGDGIIAAREGQGYTEIVARLEKRMQLVRRFTDLQDRVEDRTSYREIVHCLAADHLLDEEEAQFVRDLLAEREWGLAQLPAEAQEEFLDAAWSYATRFHFVLWDRWVRKELTERGWVIADFRQSQGHRRDFLACWRGEWALMTARVGGRTTPARYPTSRRRLVRTKFKVPVNGRCIVIPGPGPEGKRKARFGTVISKEGNGRPSSVKVLELQGSLREHPERAFHRNRWNDDAEQPSQAD